MYEQAVAIYCIGDGAAKYFGLKDDVQCKMSTSEIMTFALLSATHFEFCISPGSMADIDGLKLLPCDLPKGVTLIGDRAYTNYSLEDDLLEMIGVYFEPKRKKNMKRQLSGMREYLHASKRNIIETVFSAITSKMPRNIKARTEKGFLIKTVLFILAFLVEQYSPIG